MNDASTSPSDEQEFRELYKPLRRFAAVVAPIDVEPDDLVQEALARVLARGGLARLQSPLAYLRRSVLNLAINQQRASVRRSTVLRSVDTIEQGARAAEYPSHLWGLLDLSPLDRAVLYLADVEGWGFAEISEVTGVRESTLRGRASRARKDLRDRIEKEESR